MSDFPTDAEVTYGVVEAIHDLAEWLRDHDSWPEYRKVANGLPIITLRLVLADLIARIEAEPADRISP